MMRMMLYEAAQSMLFHSAKWSWLKAWAMKIARQRDEKGDRRPGAPVGCDYAPHLGRRYRLPLDQGGGGSMNGLQDLKR